MRRPLIRMALGRLRAGAAVALGAAMALVATGCGISLQALPKPAGVSGSTYSVHATFANVVNLPADAQVRIGAFSVGYVSGLGAKDFQAQVTMKIKSSQKVPVGTTAEIRFDTPLGEDYVTLTPPKPGGSSPAGSTAGGSTVTQAASAPAYLGDGAQIPETDTSTAPSVEDVFAALGALLNGGGIDQLQTIIHELNATFGNNQPQIHDLITQLNTTVTSFAGHSPQLISALSAVGTLSSTLRAGSTTIVNGINALAPAVTEVKQVSGSLDSLIAQVNALSVVGNKVVDQSQQNLVTTLQQLAPVAAQLSNVSSQLGPALNAIDALQVRTPAIAPGKYVQVALTANVGLPPVPGSAPPLQKATLSYAQSGIAILLEGGLP